MQGITEFIKKAEWFTMSVVAMAGVFFVVTIVQAATTISTDVTTAGNIYATSTIVATGAVRGYSTLNISGVTTLANASTSQITASGNVWVNGYATTTASNGNFATQGTLSVTGASTLTGTAIFSGLASTSQLKVGSDSVSTVSGMIFGSCTLVSVNVTATSSAYTTCTGATGVTSSYSVFMQVNNVMPAGLVVDAASSTATAGTLELRIFNANATNTPSTLTTGTPTINFWAVR